MRKLFLVPLFVLVVCCGVNVCAQQPVAQNTTDVPNMGRAPEKINGIGRLDLRVVDESGNPVRDAYAVLTSNRTDGFTCESFGSTDTRGVLPMLPIHMGALKLKVKAKGYQTTTLEVPRESLAEPVRVTLTRKG